MKVTSYSETVLPLTLPGQEPTPTYLAVSFVASFQNRWAAFEDPNRWLIRFEDDLQSDQHKSHSYTPSQGGIDDETQGQLFPNYWHNTDYMQHRIIGPVVVQVYESDVTQPGIYSFRPKIAHWDAPGYIVPDDRQLMVKGLIPRDPPVSDDMFVIKTFAGGRIVGAYDRIIEGRIPEPNGQFLTDGRLSLRAAPESPNPGYPLPGHVMTNAFTAPGTDVWNRFQMDDNDW